MDIQNSKKRVLLVITLAELGGAQKYVRDLTDAFKKEYEITIAANAEDTAIHEWAKKQKVKTVILEHLDQNLWLGFLPTLNDFKTFLDLFSLARVNHYDIVHLNSSKIGLLGALAAKFAGVPKVVFTAHGWVFNEPPSINRPQTRNKKWLWVAVSKVAAYFQDNLICVSDFDFDQALRYRIAPPRKILTIYNGLDTKKVRFASRDRARAWLKEKTSINETTTIIGTIANLYPTKDLGTMIASLAHLPQDIQLVIIGEGSEREKLRVISNELRVADRVFFLGRIPDAWQYLRAFDVYAISSVKEGLPFSALEAMAAGIPIVSTPAGGLKEIFSYENALIVPTGSPVEFAEAIKKLLQDKELQKTLAKNASQTLKKHFTLEAMVAKTRWVWEF